MCYVYVIYIITMLYLYYNYAISILYLCYNYAISMFYLYFICVLSMYQLCYMSEVAIKEQRDKKKGRKRLKRVLHQTWNIHYIYITSPEQADMWPSGKGRRGLRKRDMDHAGKGHGPCGSAECKRMNDSPLSHPTAKKKFKDRQTERQNICL